MELPESRRVSYSCVYVCVCVYLHLHTRFSRQKMCATAVLLLYMKFCHPSLVSDSLPVRDKSRSMLCFSRTLSVTLMASKKFPWAAFAASKQGRDPCPCVGAGALPGFGSTVQPTCRGKATNSCLSLSTMDLRAMSCSR